MEVLNPVAVYEFVLVLNHPIVLGVGVGEPQGKVITCQEVAMLESGFANCVQL